MKRQFVQVILVILFVIIGQSCDFDLFEKDEKQLDELSLNEEVKLSLFFVGLGATTDNVVQLRRTEKGKDETIRSFEGFNQGNFLGTDGRMISLILRDTFKGTKTKVDTFRLSIDN